MCVVRCRAHSNWCHRKKDSCPLAQNETSWPPHPHSTAQHIHTEDPNWDDPWLEGGLYALKINCTQ